MSFRFAPRSEPLEPGLAALGLAECLSRLRRRSTPVLLDSVSGSPRRFSLLAFDPLPVEPPSQLSRLESYVGSLRAAGDAAVPGFFQGGFVGGLSYDLGVVGEELDLPRDPWELPAIVGGLYTDFLVRDETTGEAWLVLGDQPGDGRPALDERRAEILEALTRPHVPDSEEAPPFESTSELAALTSGAEYRERVRAVRDFIERGEIYQANVSQRFLVAGRGDPTDLYLRLRELHPGPFSGFLRWAGGAILSGSPELLLEHDGDARSARTRPIKGTIARGASAAEDATNAARLRASEKDLAELAMIVDLERNDLGRVAVPGGVRVGEFPRLETYTSVHHLACDVVARTRAGVGPAEVLCSLFPGGSITGAPKLRSMEVIAELEGEGRGFAFGALGFLDLAGNALFNLLIRSPIWRPRPELGAHAGEVTFRVGGGITWGSDPADEEAESLVKGEALARALARSSQPVRVTQRA